MATASSSRPLAIVTGASMGIGYELARCAANDGHDLVIAADQGPLLEAAATFRDLGAHVAAVRADLATRSGVDAVMAAVGGREVETLIANAGHGLGHAFLEQPFDDVLHVINTNIVGTLDLLQRVARGMHARGHGRILVTGSIAGLMPGTFQAVYNGSKAFIDSFTFALRNELKDSGVSVTCLMPGATETHFFERAHMLDTRVGSQEKADPVDVARDGYHAMRRGDSHVVSGWKNKLQAAMSHLIPDSALAEQHRKMAEPGSARH